MFFKNRNRKGQESGGRVIRFIPDSPRAESILEHPTPASRNTPEWYRKLNKYVVPEVKCSRYPDKDATPNNTNFTAKACKPLLDSFMTGYMVTLPTDVTAVRDEAYEARMIWDSNTNMIETHAVSQLDGLQAPEEYESAPYKWNFHWAIKVPEGYSLIYTHPFNRIELPFYTMTGVVEADTYGVPVNLPFFLKKNFVGLIPKGTPVAQLIPIKREEWEHHVGTLSDYNVFEAEAMKLYMGGGYKKMYWSPKKYR